MNRPGRRPLVVGVAVVVGCLVVVAAVAVPAWVGTRVGHQLGAHVAAGPRDLSAVVSSDPGRDHTTGGVDYPDPPAGGPHHPVFLDCGVYAEPVPAELAVHSLEHGTVWITHDPELSPADRERLAGQLPDRGIMSPYDGLPAPVVVSAWGRQLHLDGPDDPRLELFVEAYGDGHTAPEPWATCHGGADLDQARRLLGGESA